MFFEVLSDTSYAVERYLSQFELDTKEANFSSTLVLPEIIREYEELVLGSQVSIKLSFYLNRHNLNLGPEEVAKGIFSYLCSGFTREYFIGRNVYVNAKILPEGVLQYMIGQKESVSTPFLSKNAFVKEVLTRVIGSEDLGSKFFTEDFKIFNQPSLLTLKDRLSIRDQRLVYLASISDPEFDETFLVKNYPTRDNPIWTFNEFERIIDTYFRQRAEDFEPQFLQSSIKSSLHTVPASHKTLKRAHEKLSLLACLYDYYLLDATRRTKPDVFWVHILELQRHVISLWNDPWIRLAIEGRSVKGDGGELDEIFRILRIFRSAIVCLLG